MNTTMFDIKSKIKQLKNTVLQMTPLEIKVRECTSNDPWGVKLSDKLEVADHTFNYEDFKLIMSVIRIRLADVGKDWRHVQKGIQLIEFLVVNGSERCLEEARDMQSLIRHLKNFKYVDDEGKDWGVNVRDAAKHFLEFMKDEKSIKEEREKAKEQKEKYEGFSRSEAKHKSRSTPSSEKKKKPTKSYDNDDEYDAPKKSTSRSSFDEDEDRYQNQDEEEEKPKRQPTRSTTPESGRPRKPSVGSAPAVAVAQKEDTLIDFFDTQPVTTAPANNYGNNNNFYGNNGGFTNQQPVSTGFNPRGGNAPTQASGNTGFNPRGNAQPSFGGNDFEANFDSSAFDDAFGNDDAFNTSSSNQQKKDSTLFDLSSGLVNLDLNETAKQPTQPVQQSSTNMTLKELKRLQGNTTPTNTTNTRPMMTTPPIPSTNYPPQNQYPPQQRGYPQQGFQQGGYPQQGFGGYPQQQGFQQGGFQQPQGGFQQGGFQQQPQQQWGQTQQRPAQNNTGGGFDFF